MGRPFGMLAGAAIGAAGSAAMASMALRNRESTEHQDHFLDAQSLDNQNASVRAIRPRFFVQASDDSVPYPPLRPRTQYYNMDAEDTETEVEPGRMQEPLRPTAHGL